MTVTAPIVIAVDVGDEREAVVARLARSSMVLVAEHHVGRSRAVLEFDVDNRTGGPGCPGEPTEVSALVRQLRDDGVAAVAGPVVAGAAGAWARRNAPVSFADASWVCVPWSVFDRSTADVIVEIDPGRGFGSGGHPTTRMILTRLATEDVNGKSVLDVGCGTGVLAIAAALLGASRVVALDTSCHAMAATEANARRNGVADRIELVDSDLADLRVPFDVVVANIGAGVLTELAPMLRRLVAPNGVLMLSGLSPAQVSVVVATLAPPLVPTWQETSDEWVAQGLRNRSPVERFG